MTALPAGPFQLTNSSTFTYNDYAASPVHRFYQMWQQLDCSASTGRPDNPWLRRLFSWVETTVGAGTNGYTQPPTSAPTILLGASTTGEGSTALGFYNVSNT